MGQTVRIEGRQGLFRVLRVDKVSRVADVMDRTGTHKMEENIPFALVRMVHQNVSEALHQFLESAAGSTNDTGPEPGIAG